MIAPIAIPVSTMPSGCEIRSPVRAPDYEPPVRQYLEVSPGHAVQVWDDEWDVAGEPQPVLLAS